VQVGTALPPAGLPNVGVRELVRGLYGESLVIADRGGRTAPRLCARWEWLEGGKTLSLTLQEGVFFHDGSRLNATTVATLLKQRFAEDPYAFTYRSVKEVKALDEQTLQIHLTRPEGLLLEDLVYVGITKAAIGTGPFLLDGPATDQGATLRRFDNYHQGRPGVERVEVRAYPSLRNAWSAMMRGEINMLHEVSREAAPFVEAESSVRAYPMLRPYVNALMFNVRHPVLSRREVRQALSYAIDRDAIVRDVMGGRGERADGPVWKYHWAFSTAQKIYDYNPDLARVKLDAAGFQTPQRVPASGDMPSRFRFTCLIMGNDSRFERIALVLQKQLYDVGVDMRIEAVPLVELAERFSSGRFDALFFETISGRSLTWLYRQWRSRPNRLPGELNSGYTAADAALDRLRETFVDADAKRAVGDLQRIFHEDPPAIFVAWPQTSRAISAKIHVPYENGMDVVGRLWRSEWAERGAGAPANQGR
jgi:peptide/nickel transport system substrate-binding protein